MFLPVIATQLFFLFLKDVIATSKSGGEGRRELAVSV